MDSRNQRWDSGRVGVSANSAFRSLYPPTRVESPRQTVPTPRFVQLTLNTYRNLLTRLSTLQAFAPMLEAPPCDAPWILPDNAGPLTLATILYVAFITLISTAFRTFPR
jgi:hypothetical protein